MIALVAVNAKYCHTSLAVRSINSFLEKKGLKSIICEFTINDVVHRIIKRLVEADADIYAFSCYIWNIELIKKICIDLKIIRPDCEIWLGGPEVSFDPGYYPFADKVICGEGEETMASILENGDSSRVVYGEAIKNLDDLPFAYNDLGEIGDRLVYYESSRGCPFNCSYCLSSSIKGVRYRSLDRVFEDILKFEKAKTPLVKFVDRTFNADKKRTIAIWRFIQQHCVNTAFHFEIEGELLDQEQIDVLLDFNPGMAQLEIGVQSTNMQTLDSVNRKSDTDKLLRIIKRLSAQDKVHIHADLIAGMPYESYDRFGRSFDELYACKPHCIQLGFLKLLKGSAMRENSVKWNYKFSEFAPYTVYSNDFISYEELKRLEDIAYLVDKYYNSNCFDLSLNEAIKGFASPFSFYEALYEFMEEKGYFDRPLSRKFLYEVLYDFHGEDTRFLNILKLDYLGANGRPCPAFMGRDELLPLEGYEDKYESVKLLFNKNKRMR